MTSPPFDAWVERARSARIEGFARHRGIALKGNNERCGPCPKCAGADRFSINVTKQVFNCRQCGGSGKGAIDFVMFLDNVDFTTACETLTGEERPPPPRSPNGHDTSGESRHVTAWIYKDADGKPFLKVDRYDKPDGGKSYPQAHWDGTRWIKGKPAGPKIPYRLPELIDSDRTEPVYITEGEKCADAVAGLGLTATSASEGAGKWTADLNKHFRDRIVWILPDNDEQGAKHAEQVAQNLAGVAREVRIVNLPGLAAKGDAYDWIKQGGTREQLDELGEAASPFQAKAQDEPPIVITLAQFLAKFEPPDYLIEGLLQRHYLYFLTGMTGGGKTAVGALLAVLVGLKKPGQKFGPYAVKHGRVAYIAAENATDIQMRFPPLLTKFGVNAADLDILVIDRVIDLEKDLPRVEREIREFGDVDLVIVDTSPRLFNGTDINDDKQMLDHAVRLRGLTWLPGHPCVVANGHPIKYPKTPADLLPKGGGAYLNEGDGNLTLWKHDNNLTDLHWAGKFRGPDFTPITFRLDVVYATANVDKGGKLLPTVMASHITDAEVEAVEVGAVAQEDQLLAAVRDKPRGSLADWATACGWFHVKGNDRQPNKQLAQRIVARLVKTKLLAKQGRDHILTQAGKKALKKTKTEEEREASNDE